MSRFAALSALFLVSACGFEGPSSHVNIQGGWGAGPNDREPVYYHTAALVTSEMVGAGKAFCSGTLIADRVILTAAHCVIDDEGNPVVPEIRVQFGERVSAENRTYRVVKTLPHPNYRPKQAVKPDPDAVPNDIALLLLDVKPAAPFRPVALFEGPLSDDHKVVPAGFGITTNGLVDNDSGRLRAVRVGVRRIQKDAKRFSSSTFLKGACSGDSGGPAYFEQEGGLALAGVVSSGAMFVLTCFGDNYYTDVSQYVNWIRTSMRRL